jgi:hypothetical protein
MTATIASTNCSDDEDGEGGDGKGVSNEVLQGVILTNERSSNKRQQKDDRKGKEKLKQAEGAVGGRCIGKSRTAANLRALDNRTLNELLSINLF